MGQRACTFLKGDPIVTTHTRYRVRQERPHWTNWGQPLGWFVYGERPGRHPTVSWHATWAQAWETADWLAHYGRSH